MCLSHNHRSLTPAGSPLKSIRSWSRRSCHEVARPGRPRNRIRKRGRHSTGVLRSRFRWGHAAAAVIIAIGVSLLATRPAAADPVDPAFVPENLRHYVPTSAEWLASPWMTSEGCRDHGGDWSIYATNLIKDLPDLLLFFQPDFAGVNDAEAAARKEFFLKQFRELPANIAVPAGYCVNMAKKWATPNPQFQPFGFEWGNAKSREHGVAVGLWQGCSRVRPDDLAPCRGFYISCDGAATQQEEQACQAWNTFSDDYVKRVSDIAKQAFTRHPVTLVCERDCGPVPDIIMDIIEAPADMVQDFINWVAKKGMEQVVSFIVSGVIHLWGVFTRIAVDYSSPNLSGNSFASVYNLIAGIALALAFLGWLFTLATSWKRGHLQYSLFGGIKAVVGVTLAGVGAILMVQLADECTKSLISAGGGITRQADFTTSLMKANPLVAILAGVMITISLIFAIIFLVINAPLVLMWALFGSIAAAGQVHEASSGWLLRWAGRLTALAWAKFFMIGVLLLAQALLLPLDAGEDPVRQVMDVVQGLFLCVLLILCPWLLWELVDFVGDRVGGVAASGGVGGRAASSGTTGVARAARGAVGSAGAAVGAAVGAMVVAASHVGRHFPGGSTTSGSGGGGAGGGGASRPPRPEVDTAPDNAIGNEDGGERETPAVPTSAGSSHGRGGADQMSPKQPANRGRVVASRGSTSTPPASAGRPPAGSPVPGDSSEAGTRVGPAPPRIPPA
jgi:hypothetical protein